MSVVRTVSVRLPNEDEMADAIKGATEARGGIVWHVRDSRGLDVEDMPDLIAVLPPTVYLIELKGQRRATTPGQAHALDVAGECVRVWSGIVRPRPKHPTETSYDQLIDVLRGVSG